MLEDRLLILKCKRGSRTAFQRIYEKYESDLRTLAANLLDDKAAAEDVVHDVFVSFAGSAKDFKLGGNLKSYLTTCVMNRARDRIRASLVSARHEGLVHPERSRRANLNGPDHAIISSEESQRLNRAIAQLPKDQREVIALHLKGKMTFSQIAKMQNVSINTIQGRYRYGLNKLRSVLNGEVEK